MPIESQEPLKGWERLSPESVGSDPRPRPTVGKTPRRAQKLGQLQPFLAVLPQEGMGQLASCDAPRVYDI